MSEEFVEDIITAAVPDATPAHTPVAGDEPAKPDIPAATPDVQPATPDVTIDSLATDLGWKPDHSGDNYVDAATFILRSKEIQTSMKDHNKDLKKQLINLQGSVDSLKVHNERVYKADVTKMQAEIDKLKKERTDAIELADVATVNELDAKITGIEQTLNEPQPVEPVSTDGTYDNWVKDNNWYLTEPAMTKYADAVADQYAGAPLDKLFPLVRAKVAEVFPEHFASPPSAATNPVAVSKPIGPASPVEAGTKTSAAKTFTAADLTSEQTSIMKQFVSSGIMTEDQYITDLAKLQGE